MTPEQVTDKMDQALQEPLSKNYDDIYSAVLRKRGIAAAINAMPDDLLRELVKERGCVLVPREPTEAMLDAFKRRYKEGDFWRERIHGAVAAMLAAAETPAAASSEREAARG